MAALDPAAPVTTIAVVIPHLPEPRRQGLYLDALASVETQTRKPDQLIIEEDPEHTGAGVTLNRALARVECEWIAQLGDDDLFLPSHLQVLADAVEDGYDVIYPECRTLGAYVASGGLGGPFDRDRLIQRGNYIPGGGSLVRTEAARRVGGWCQPGDDDYHRYEDYVMWLRLLLTGSNFKYVPVPTWVYRFHPLQTGGKVD